MPLYVPVLITTIDLCVQPDDNIITDFWSLVLHTINLAGDGCKLGGREGGSERRNTRACLIILRCHIVLLVNLHGCTYHHGCACVRDVKRVWHLVGRLVDGSIMRNEAQYYFGNGSNISTPSLSPTHINYALIHTCMYMCMDMSCTAIQVCLFMWNPW